MNFRFSRDRLCRIVVIFAAIFFAPWAMATCFTSGGTSFSSYTTSFTSLGTVYTYQPCAVTPSASTAQVSTATQQATTVQQTTLISSVVSNILGMGMSARPSSAPSTPGGGGSSGPSTGPGSPSGPTGSGSNKSSSVRGTGLAAGEAYSPWTVWGALSHTDTGSGYVNLLYSGSVESGIGAFNYQFSDFFMSGLSLSYNTSSITTQYNSGGSKTRSYSLAPYLGLKLNDYLSLDAAVGFGSQRNSMNSNAGATTAKINSDQSFATVNLNAVRWIDDWQLAGKVGYMHSEEKQKSFSDSANTNFGSLKNRTAQIYIGGQIGYWTSGVMPYIGVKYGRDIKHVDITVNAGTSPLPANDKNSLMVDLGLNLFSMKNWSGGIAYSSEQMRKEVKNNSLMGNISYRF